MSARRDLVGGAEPREQPAAARRGRGEQQAACGFVAAWRRMIAPDARSAVIIGAPATGPHARGARPCEHVGEAEAVRWHSRTQPDRPARPRCRALRQAAQHHVQGGEALPASSSIPRENARVGGRRSCTQILAARARRRCSTVDEGGARSTTARRSSPGTAAVRRPSRASSTTAASPRCASTPAATPDELAALPVRPRRGRPRSWSPGGGFEARLWERGVSQHHRRRGVDAHRRRGRVGGRGAARGIEGEEWPPTRARHRRDPRGRARPAGRATSGCSCGVVARPTALAATCAESADARRGVAPTRPSRAARRRARARRAVRAARGAGAALLRSLAEARPGLRSRAARAAA